MYMYVHIHICYVLTCCFSCVEEEWHLPDAQGRLRLVWGSSNSACEQPFYKTHTCTPGDLDPRSAHGIWHSMPPEDKRRERKKERERERKRAPVEKSNNERWIQYENVVLPRQGMRMLHLWANWMLTNRSSLLFHPIPSQSPNNSFTTAHGSSA